MPAVTAVVDLIKLHEGCQLKPYIDTAGKITIGFGHNLDDRGIPQHMADDLFERDLNRCLVEGRQFDWYTRLNAPRRAVIVDMLYNLGLPRFRQFEKLIAALERDDTDEAAEEMLTSKWAVQVGQRAQRLSLMMRSGEWPAV